MSSPSDHNTPAPTSVPGKSAAAAMPHWSDSDSDLEAQPSMLDGLNVPDRLKHLLSYGRQKTSAATAMTLDDDDDDDALFFERSTPALAKPIPSLPLASSPARAGHPTITSTSTRLQPLETDDQRKERFQQYLTKTLYSDSSDDARDDEAAKPKKKKRTKKSAKAKPAEPKEKKPSKTAPKKKKKKKQGDEDGGSDGHASRPFLDLDDDVFDESDASDGRAQQKRKQRTAALLADSSDDDDDMPHKPRPLSKKAQLEMQKEAQRLRRSNQVMIKPRVTRKTMDDLLQKLALADQPRITTDDAVMVEAPVHETVEESGYGEDMEGDESEGDRSVHQQRQHSHVAFYLSGPESATDSSNEDDDLIIVGKPKRRGDKLLQKWESIKSLQSTSPDRIRTGATPHGLASPPSPWRATNFGHRHEDRLRALNQRLLAKIGKDQQAHRQKMEDKAKALGIYMTPEERAKTHLEREQEAAVLDVQVQQLLKRRGPANMPNQQDGGMDDLLLLSGEEDDDDESFVGDDDASDDHSLEDNPMDIEQEDGQGGSRREDNRDDDDDDDMPMPSQRHRTSRRSKHRLLLDDNADIVVGTTQQKQGPEPTNSIARFFGGASTLATKEVSDDDLEDTSPTLTRLMKRSSLLDDESLAADTDLLDENSILPSSPLAGDHSSTADAQPASPSPFQQHSPTPIPRTTLPKSQFMDHEAEESEDEFYGVAGEDEPDTEDLDRFEQDGMLVHETDETVDTLALQAQHNQQLLESDQHMVEKLIKDITSGGLRRKRAAAAAGLLLDDYDLYDDEGDDLVALRLAAASKRKKHLNSDDPLKQLADDPRTSAFAKAAMEFPGGIDLSGDEMGEDSEQDQQSTNDDEQGGDGELDTPVPSSPLVDQPENSTTQATDTFSRKPHQRFTFDRHSLLAKIKRKQGISS
ncbi:hypothetical protein DM01DRAFT_1405431 [Hesseltinella vesiculosa]|uniref:DNA replication checkpoint mediator MRC1 domain-containing protein n=1 Tax=Hesseltinella vesiculosa TaxID=101127 RepID=A0A1X2GPY1_9FUNG|nr:hypothetical protein DM01DRAFT_1405431 [Hesseltinella vesiculosa]